MKKALNITAEGKKELEMELMSLRSRRPELAEKIAIARGHGDLSENEDYSAARGEQKVVEGRILEIENILKNASIIRAGKREKVVVGANVTLSDGKKFLVVGAVEANPLEGKISDASPLGQAMLGKKVGDEVVLPNGKSFQIAEIG